MTRFSAALLLALTLAACGRPGGGGQADAGSTCALLAHPEALFGAGAEQLAARGVGDGSCRWQSTDGQRGGEIIVFSGAHLDGKTAQAFLAETAQHWGAAQPDYPVEALNGVGEEAQIANHLPGYQTQIVFRKGERVVTLQAWSGDPALSGEQLARRMAASVANALN